jgi:uncharacterized RDD family membrane protein YckC
MKCPKCHYLSFEPEARCRNCGYDLALSEPDLSLARDEPEGPLADFDLHTRQTVRKKAPDTLGPLHPYGEVTSAFDADEEGQVAHLDVPPVWEPVRAGREARDVAKAARPVEKVAARTQSELPQPRPAGALPAASPAPPVRGPEPEPEAELDESGLPPIRRPATVVRALTPEPVADGQLPPPRPERPKPPVDRPAVPAPPPVVVRPPKPPPAPPPPRPSASASPRPPARPAPTTELPLFVKGMADQDVAPDEPLVKVPPSPRPPIAVQRPSPPLARPAASAARSAEPPRKLDSFGRDLLQDLERLDRTEKQPTASVARARAAMAADDVPAPATRLAAAAIDTGFIGSVGLAIFWLTLRWCGLSLSQAAAVPRVPLAAFVLLIAIGYLLLFTVAGGQTIGKMACGLRVVGDDPEEGDGESVTLRQAFFRALVAVPSVLALGAGFVPALVGEGLAFHDRIAHTRVIRA